MEELKEIRELRELIDELFVTLYYDDEVDPMDVVTLRFAIADTLDYTLDCPDIKDELLNLIDKMIESTKMVESTKEMPKINYVIHNIMNELPKKCIEIQDVQKMHVQTVDTNVVDVNRVDVAGGIVADS
jgi:predicted membrane chloride channel (bestrophin family)